jgi:large subunit ribosomal protein L11
VCLTIPAKNASLLPPVGPFLGQHGFNTMGFCTNFNNITKNFPDSLPLKVSIKLFTDKTIQFQIRTPPVSFLLYSSYLNNNTSGIKLNDLLKIIFIKRIDNSELSINSMLPTLIGTARSMKIKIIK